MGAARTAFARANARLGVLAGIAAVVLLLAGIGAGVVDALAGATADALPHKASGAFRVLGIAAEQPDKSMPEVPTMKSMGYDVLAASWTGIVAPAGTPAISAARTPGP